MTLAGQTTVVLTKRKLSRTVASVSCALAFLAMAGCGNKGANSSCGEFLGYNDSGQVKAATDLMQSHGLQTDTDDVDETVGSIRAYCGLSGNDATISGIYNG